VSARLFKQRNFIRHSSRTDRRGDLHLKRLATAALPRDPARSPHPAELLPSWTEAARLRTVSFRVPSIAIPPTGGRQCCSTTGLRFAIVAYNRLDRAFLQGSGLISENLYLEAKIQREFCYVSTTFGHSPLQCQFRASFPAPSPHCGMCC
jgi:hypothetical protein